MCSNAVTLFKLSAIATAIGLAAHDLMDRWRILVVDDNRDVAVALSRLLAIDGHETFLAHDGVEALDVAAKIRPKMVLLDLGMSGLDGYEVCRRLRASHADRDLLIVAMTGWTEEGDRQRSLDAGFDEYLVKPVAYASLLSLLTSFCQAIPL
jgi:CheY-like chemotaxis protein